MGRLARVVLPKVPHHITQRGVRSMPIFWNDDDRKEYLWLLKEHSEANGFEILAYCLMDNHIHLLGIPDKEESLRRSIGEAHRLYTRRINFREKVRGHLFQGRFFSCPLSPQHLSSAIRYVERNPVRAKMCDHAKDYEWSSARFHLSIVDKDPLVKRRNWFGSQENWNEYLQEDSENIEQLRLHFRTGRPLGDENFLKKAERISGRDLIPKKAGRPKK